MVGGAKDGQARDDAGPRRGGRAGGVGFLAAGGGGWLLFGALWVVVGAAAIWLWPANDSVHEAAGKASFMSAQGVSTLAGFTFLAAALERFAEFALAPWWGKVSTTKSGRDAAGGRAPRVGVSGAAALQVRRAAGRQAAAAGGAAHDPDHGTGAVDPDDLYEQTTRTRPTIMLPIAAIAAVLCSSLHLYLLHSLARSGVPDTRTGFLLDGLLTGFAIAGGSQPFHDLVGNLTASAAAKQGAAKASSTAS